MHKRRHISSVFNQKLKEIPRNVMFSVFELNDLEMICKVNGKLS